jgi:hypothetical protein
MTSGEKLTVAVFLLSLRVLAGIVTHGAPRDNEDPKSRFASLTAVDEALARGDVGAADRAWRTAHAVVGRTSRWRDFTALGDSALRIGDKSDQRGAYVAHAREAYLAALVHARDEGSVEGVTRVWRAFTVLGDYDVAAQCAIIAEKLQARLYVTTVTSRSMRGGPGSRIDP